MSNRNLNIFEMKPNNYSNLVDESNSPDISVNVHKLQKESVPTSIELIKNGYNSKSKTNILDIELEQSKSLIANPENPYQPTTISSNNGNCDSEPPNHCHDLSDNKLDHFLINWSKVSFDYKPKWYSSKKANKVLKDISGQVASNQLVAMIGPSGCGKTTLLHCLAGHLKHDEGKITSVGLKQLKVALMAQDDCLLPGLTVRETLIYASKLQNHQSSFDHNSHVDQIIHRLGLEECANRNVTKLSGGQTKRVSIAQEILYPTNLLLLDEVTSGLDASTSLSIVKILRQLTQSTEHPMCVVVSIHQPSARIFSVFDKVYAMSEGRCLYEGSCEADIICNYLSSFDLTCPKYTNVADMLIEIACNDFGHDLKEKILALRNKSSSLYPVPTNDTSLVNHTLEYDLHILVNRTRTKKQSPFFQHVGIHLERSWKRIRRSYALTYLQVATYIVLGLQLSTFYGPQVGQMGGCPREPISLTTYLLNDNTVIQDQTLEMRRVQENLNFLLVAIMTTTFAALEITVLSFPMDARAVKREWKNGWYKTTSYFLGRTIADLPFQIIFVILFSVVVFLLTGQYGFLSWRFLSFTFILMTTALVAQSVGFIFGAIFMNNLPAAVFTAPLCIFPALLFSGFFSRVSEVPRFYKPLTFLSHFRYAFDAIIVTLYGFNRCECDNAILLAYQEFKTKQSEVLHNVFYSMLGNLDCSEDNLDENGINDYNEIVSHKPSTHAMSNMTVSQLASNDSTITDHHRHNNITDLARIFLSHGKSEFDSANYSNASKEYMSDMVHHFSNKITDTLNQQANFGKVVPTNCSNFDPYLINEFNLKNSDLYVAILALVVFVLLSRLLCSYVLSCTITRRS